MSQISPPTAPEPVSPKIRPSTFSKVFAMREAGTLVALVLMLLVIALAIPQFRQWENIVNITRNFSFVGIVAMGMTLVILTGGIDLSVGSSLSEADAKILFRVIADLKAQGVTMLYISHRFPEVFADCNAVTVLRDGNCPQRQEMRTPSTNLMLNRYEPRAKIHLATSAKD